jgi:hypothetical protein
VQLVRSDKVYPNGINWEYFSHMGPIASSSSRSLYKGNLESRSSYISSRAGKTVSDNFTEEISTSNYSLQLSLSEPPCASEWSLEGRSVSTCRSSRLREPSTCYLKLGLPETKPRDKALATPIAGPRRSLKSDCQGRAGKKPLRGPKTVKGGSLGLCMQSLCHPPAAKAISRS